MGFISLPKSASRLAVIAFFLSTSLAHAAAAPVAQGITPTTGTAGQSATIWGLNFNSGSKVYINGVQPSQVTVAGTQYLVFPLPNSTVTGAVDVKVVNADGQSSTLSKGFTYTGATPAPSPTPSPKPTGAAPSIGGITPNSGAAGNSATIWGNNFNSTSKVFINGIAPSQVTLSGTQYLVFPLPNSTSTTAVDVKVVNGDGQSALVTKGFTYTSASPAPSPTPTTQPSPTPTSAPAPAPTTSASCTKYVSPSGSVSGTSASTTIQAGINSLSAGDTLCVAAGTYHELVQFTKSGTASAPITVRALDPNNKPTIDGQYNLPGGAMGGNDFVQANCQEYSVNPNANQGPLPLMGCMSNSTGSPLLTVQGNHIVWDGINVTRSRGTGVVIGNATGGGWFVADHTIYTDIKFRNSTINGTRNAGVFVVYADHLLFDGNTITDSSNFAAYDRPGSWNGHNLIVDMAWPNALTLVGTNLTVTNNHIYHNWDEGVQIGTGVKDLSGQPAMIDAPNLVFKHNILHDNWAVTGIYIAYVNTAVIEDNLIYGSNDPKYFRNGSPQFCVHIAREGASGLYNPKNMTFANNIVAGCSNLLYFADFGNGATFSNFAFYNNTLLNPYPNGVVFSNNLPAGTLINFTFQNNLVSASRVFGSANNFGNASGITVGHNLWPSSPGSLFTGSGDVISSSPGLTNASYAPPVGGIYDASVVKLSTSSPALSKGISIPGITDDYFGKARPATPDIGAYQH